jgi:glycosyltransferase involved in cell wall biosynthesis
LTAALDATYSLGDTLTGVGVYSQHLMRGLAEAYPDENFLWCYRIHRFRAALETRVPANARRRLFGDYWTPAADVFHGLNQRLPRRPLRNAVATFHDLFVMTGEYSSADFRRRFEKQAREAAKRSDLIIAVSEFTANQVTELLGVERARIRVIPHGAGAVETAATPREAIILSVGALQARKNILRLIDAFERIDAPGWRLVLAGSQGWGASAIVDRVNTSAQRGRIDLLGFVSDHERESLYRRCGIFAFPSLDEGFGIPVLEAMAAGAPVLTSNRSSLPEVAGDAALLVDPYDVDAIAGGLEKLVKQAPLREALVERGYERARQFTWERAIHATWRVYKEVAGKGV